MSWLGTEPEGNSSRQEYIAQEIDDAASMLMRSADDLRSTIEELNRKVYAVRSVVVEPDAARRASSAIANKADSARRDIENGEAAINDLMRYLSGDLGV